MTFNHFLYTASNAIGMVGVVMVLFAYLMLQIHKMNPHSISYSLINFIGSILILVSLYYHLNWASLVIEVAWLLISLYGLFNASRVSRKTPESH